MTAIYYTARLNARVQPIARGEIWEDPLDELLKLRDLGEVTGGGSQLDASGEIIYCEIEIAAKNDSSETRAAIIDALTKLGAPKGSKLMADAGEMPFGDREGLAVYLNGTDLPPEVYEQSDVNFVFSEFDRLLAPAGQIYSYMEGATETALYMYGPSFMTMKTRLADFIASYPLCQKARVEQIA
jgi:hypothetical protein